MKAETSYLSRSYDPYDPWMGPRGVQIRRGFYEGRVIGKLAAIAVGLSDWFFPHLFRKLLGVSPRAYPITVAQRILMDDKICEPGRALEALISTAVLNAKDNSQAWGLGFPWMSKNGLYSDTVPFITHTPYAMEALLELSKYREVEALATTSFNSTWDFLESLLILADDKEELALSYAPVPEPRIVVNANSYACLAYCLHAMHNSGHAPEARSKARRLARWVVNQQNDDGSWHYYADSESGNFIDCFHSCFILKNLLKASKTDDEIRLTCLSSIDKGKRYIDSSFYDKEKKMVRRFTERDIKDPFVWDLYDQAEYLGLLVESGDIAAAQTLAASSRRHFLKGATWYCKLDFLGRKWGPGFDRWGIVPFLYSESRLKKIVEDSEG